MTNEYVLRTQSDSRRVAAATCPDAFVEWLAEQPDFQTAVSTCERGDWLWWYLWKTHKTNHALCVAFARSCADAACRYADAEPASAAAAMAAAAAAMAAALATDDAGDAERRRQADWIRKNYKGEW